MSGNSLAEHVSVNLYLKLKPNSEVNQLITAFNHSLASRKLLSLYKIKPYLDRYPTHITLYLTEYKKERLPQLRQAVLKLSRKQQSVTIQTEQLDLYANGYIMLKIKNNNELQQLSRQALSTFSPWRAQDTIIPEWAAQDRRRQALFAQYGSPNVLAYFNPHISILMAPPLSTTSQRNRQLRQAIRHFSHNHKIKLVSCATELALGIANDEGQIIEELVALPLTKTADCT